MTLQEIFDRVAIHLIEQGRAAIIGDGRCRYRNDEGEMCAFGCLIPDDMYDLRMEGRLANDVILIWGLRAKLNLSDDDIDLIADLQVAHDEPLRDDGLEAWKDRMHFIAKQYKLSPESLNHRAQSTKSPSSKLATGTAVIRTNNQVTK